MKLNLNLLKFTALAVTLSVFTTSCDLFDKEDPKPATNEITYNNTKYTLDESLMIKYGSFSLYGDENVHTHMNNDFYLADGIIDYSNTTKNVESISGTLAIYAELASAGTTEFKTGTFNYVDTSNDDNLSDAQLEAKYKNKSVFSSVEVFVDTDGDGLVSDETPIKANNGTVKVSGSNNNYTLEFDLTLTNGKTIKGKNSSSFSPVNG